MNNQTYNIFMLIKDLKREIKKILHIKILSDENLSLILGQAKSHIETLKNSSRKSISYQIAEKFIESYKNNLKNQFKDKNKDVIKFIIKYQDSNLLKWSNSENLIMNFHPDLKFNYFKNIDTKKKAYWLGWIFAEGYLYKDKTNNVVKFGVEISNEDIILIKRFTADIGYNLKHKHIRKERNLIMIYTSSRVFVQHLVDRFTKDINKEREEIIGKMKSKNIELPEFGERKLDLAFLLGFYDGDGIQGETAIISGSKIFLKQIKKKYNIIHKIRFTKSESFFEGRLIKGSAWRMSLGAEIFNEMMDNFENSLPRKRKVFKTKEEKVMILAKYANKRKKFRFTKEQLEELVWKMPLKDIAINHKNLYEVSISTALVSQYCKKWNINKPNRGYWKPRRQINISD